MTTATKSPAPASPLLAAMQAQVGPSRAQVGCNEVVATLAGPRSSRLLTLASLPLGRLGHRLVALRYFIANGPTWMRHFAWEVPLAKQLVTGPVEMLELNERVLNALAEPSDEALWSNRLETSSLLQLAGWLEADEGTGDEGLRLLVALHQHPSLASALRARLRAEAGPLTTHNPRAADVLYLACYELSRLPATTVGEGRLEYLIVADKGEMGVRAVREAVAFGATPVVVFSEQDDADSLQVRLAHRLGGFGVGLRGTFKETYANPVQIAARVKEVYRERFSDQADLVLARSALYPGYGPLAENSAAIAHFRQEAIAFVGPMQDVVERAGDKRKFRQLAESIDPGAVTPGIVLDETNADAIVAAIEAGHAAGRFGFPARIKAANGGGGRGQVVCADPSGVRAAVQRVLGEITSNGWDPGVMFEQNIPETIHLEVQVVRDRFGNARHFGMRDCSEQRANQKIQEEAPPALLRHDPVLAERIANIAVGIADSCGYVGACTVELMYKAGHFYLLEMNTRIQVEHPVSEEAHRLRLPDGTLAPLDLVALQLQVAAGRPLSFSQEDVESTHVAREFRINAEAWRKDLKDPRDGQKGFFLPNAGVFDVIEVPASADVLSALEQAGVKGVREVNLRFDVGFEPGDRLVNKDPTFGKLIVAVAPLPGFEEGRYELLRLASLEVLRRTRIEGRQVLPNGAVIAGSKLETNLAAHVRILETEMMREHATAVAKGRHVNWVVGMLRQG